VEDTVEDIARLNDDTSTQLLSEFERSVDSQITPLTNHSAQAATAVSAS
jgi:hypothetical protein